MNTSSLYDNLLSAIARIPDPTLGAEIQTLAKLLQAELTKLQAEHNELKDAAAGCVNIADYTWEKNVYRKDGRAYCTRCLEEERKARTVLQHSEYSSKGYCTVCKTESNNVFQAKHVTQVPQVIDDWRKLG
jgi:hypothetical protein